MRVTGPNVCNQRDPICFVCRAGQVWPGAQTNFTIAITQSCATSPVRVAELAGVEVACQDHRTIAPLVRIAAHRSQLRLAATEVRFDAGLSGVQ